MNLLVTFILISTIPSIILLDLNISYENYNPKILHENLPGYGRTWMYFPDGNGVPQIAQLDLPDLIPDGDAAPRRLDLLDPTHLVAAAFKESDVTFHLYTRYNKQRSQLLRIHNTLPSNFDSKRPTKIVTHGWTSSKDSQTCQSIKNNYLEVEDANVILIDWHPIAHHTYPMSALQTRQIGEYVARMVDFLADNGLDVNKVHMIGHSLGAHICGIAGSEIKNGNVARITGLDPALPGFEHVSPLKNRLDKGDAQFVDVIHTCGGVLGFYTDLGDVDFYPNGGVPSQPGCLHLNISSQQLEACSHDRSWQFYEESIKFPNAYIAYRCGSWISFTNGDCNQGRKIPMGYSTPTTEHGLFYLHAQYSPSSPLPPRVAPKHNEHTIIDGAREVMSLFVKN